jgi:hypothetical protein
MKRSTFVCAAILMALSAMTAFAADLTGVWSGEIAGPDGENFKVSFTFKQAGAKLTGTVTGPQGDPLEINDGKVEGDKVSFSVAFNGMTIKHEGAINGEEIKMTLKADGDFPGGAMTLKKSK